MVRGVRGVREERKGCEERERGGVKKERESK